MRIFTLSLFICLFFGITSCAESLEDQAAPSETNESNLTVVHDFEARTLGFGLRSEVLENDRPNSFNSQVFFLTAQDVKAGGITSGTSTAIRITISRRSTKPATDFRFEIGDHPNAQNEPGNDEMTLVSVTGFEDMDFTTGTQRGIFDISDGVLILKTNATTGVQTIYLDASGPNDYQINGTWKGKLAQVAFPFF